MEWRRVSGAEIRPCSGGTQERSAHGEGARWQRAWRRSYVRGIDGSRCWADGCRFGEIAVDVLTACVMLLAGRAGSKQASKQASKPGLGPSAGNGWMQKRSTCTRPSRRRHPNPHQPPSDPPAGRGNTSCRRPRKRSPNGRHELARALSLHPHPPGDNAPPALPKQPQAPSPLTSPRPRPRAGWPLTSSLPPSQSTTCLSQRTIACPRDPPHPHRIPSPR